MKIEILNELGEVENTIIADEEFAEQFYSGRWREAIKQEPGPIEPIVLPIIVITNMTVSDDPRGVARIADDFTTLKMPVGATVTIDAELRYGGELVPSFGEEFAMPLRSTDGSMRYINVQFESGKTTFSATMNDSKRWEVDKELINSDLPQEAHMDFAGVVITAVE